MLISLSVFYTNPSGYFPLKENDRLFLLGESYPPGIENFMPSDPPNMNMKE